jgi:argonaute-like protein implicated in RNA metabolism and viral defense
MIDSNVVFAQRKEDERLADVFARDQWHVSTMRAIAASIRGGLGNVGASEASRRARNTADDLVRQLTELEAEFAVQSIDRRKRSVAA